MDIPVGNLLKDWQSYVTTISRNLMELSEQTDVKIIKSKVKDAANGYTGLTKAKAEKTCGDLDSLWRYYALLSKVVDKAADLYSRDSFLKDTEGEVRELLERTPVTLETERIEISSRTLLTPETREIKVRLQELLKLMQDLFEATRNDFNEISSAAKTLEIKLQAVRNEISSLNDAALRIGIKNIPAFNIEKVSRIGSDPLSDLAELDVLFQNVENYKASIKALEREYNETQSSINRSSDMIGEMEDLAKKSEKAVLESERIFGVVKNIKPVIGGEVIDSLKDWLAILESKLSEGNVNAAKIGTQRLEKECTLKLEAERENYYTNCRDYNEWLDLKGEFKALLAKLNGLKARGLLFNDSIDVLIENLQRDLYADRVNLGSCRMMIERLRSSLRS